MSTTCSLMNDWSSRDDPNVIYVLCFHTDIWPCCRFNYMRQSSKSETKLLQCTESVKSCISTDQRALDIKHGHDEVDVRGKVECE